MRSALVVAVCMVFSALPSAYAIVPGLEDTSEFANPSSDWYGMTLDGIGKVGGGSAVAVGNHWFLSVAHFWIAPGHQITMSDGSLYTVTEVHNAPLLGQSNPPDLRVIRVAEETEDWYDLYAGALSPGIPVIMAGTGFSGTVNAAQDTFEYSFGTPRTWRWGTNSIDGPKWMLISGGSGTFYSACLEMGFVDTDTDYEAGFAIGDSGAGTFLLDDGRWKLAGINAYIDRLGPGEPPPWDVSYAVTISSYADWIRTIVPGGDINDNDLINAEDIDLLYDYIDSLGGSGSVPPADALSDLNSDFTVDTGDVAFLIRKILRTEYGDFNLDGLIDTTDLTILATNFDLPGMGYADGDANGDGVIDTTDLTILATYFGFDASAAASVPEPASIALMGAAVLLGLRRRRRA